MRGNFTQGAAKPMAGVYDWIRDGVKRAVLLGFSDAVEQLGVPHEERDELHAGFAAQLSAPTSTRKSVGKSGPGGRKRLGRSLNQLAEPDAQAA